MQTPKPTIVYYHAKEKDPSQDWVKSMVIKTDREKPYVWAVYANEVPPDRKPSDQNTIFIDKKNVQGRFEFKPGNIAEVVQ